LKAIAEVLKIALLLIIVVLLSINAGVLQNPVAHDLSPSQPRNTAATRDRAIEPSAMSPSQRERDLRKILEHSLAKNLKFPESIRFQGTKFQYNRVFGDHEIEVPLEKELERATLCGQYAAQNAMGVYGTYSPFYAEVGVDNSEKQITGDVWFKIDGELKKLLSLDSSVLMSADTEEFDRLYSKNCGQLDRAYMGEFNQYKIGYAALSATYLYEKIDKLSRYPGSLESLQSCLRSSASRDYCVFIEFCQKGRDVEEGMHEMCDLHRTVCLATDKPADCEAKMEVEFKKKKSSAK
jgi:hypothetical protein